MPYNTEGKTQKLAIPIGVHAIHSGNGKLIEHLAETLTGGGVSVKCRLALGESPFHEIEKVTYDGIDIDAEYWEFHKNSDVDPADTMFPNRPLNPGAAFIDIELPPGIDVDNQPDKFVIRAKCLELAQYDNEGNQIDFGFSDSPADAAAFAAVHQTGENDLLDWEYYIEFREWCAENITVNIDGVDQELPRFPLNFFLIPPYNLEHFLDRVCQLTCSDWTWANGKIRLLAPIDREPVMTLDPSNISRIFKHQATESDTRYNGVEVSWRNIAHPFLIQEDALSEPFDRRTDPNEPENFYQINAGVCRKDVAERIGNFWAKVKCDLTDFAFIKTSRKGFILLPGDIVLVTHPEMGWVNKRCKIIKKTEKEDPVMQDGASIFEGYGLFVQVEPENPYSDTDFEPIETREPVTGLNPFSVPQAPTLTLQQQINVNNDNTSSKSILGIVNFQAFGLGQYAKVYWKQPGSSTWERVGDYREQSNKAEFRQHNVALGTHYFRAVAYSDRHLPQSDAVVDYSIIITASTFFVGDFNVPVGVGRALAALDNSNNYVGNDTNIVPRDRIIPKVTRGTIIDNGLNVDCTIGGVVTGAKTDPTSNGEVIFQSITEVYNKFGELCHTFEPEGFQGAGTIADGVFSRKYADAFEEATFKIQVRNRSGWSLPRFLYNTSTASNTPPTYKSRSDCPLDVVATPLTASSISFSGTFNFTGKTLKLQKREVGQRFADWVDHVTGISAFPFVATGFPADKELEFRLVSSSGTNNSSNIVRAKTFQVGQEAPARPIPQGLTIAPDSANPTQNLDVDWTRNAIDNTGVDIEINGSVTSLSASIEHYDLNSIGEGTSRTVRVRNTWSSGVPASDWTDYATASTQVTPPASTPPQNFQGSYDLTNKEADFTFELGTGSGTHTLEISDNGTSGWTNAKTGITTTSFSHSLAQTTSQYSKFFRLKRTDVDGYAVDIVEIIVPAQANDWRQPQIMNAYASSISSSQFIVECNFIPRGGNGGFSAYFDDPDGISNQWIGSYASNINFFSFNVDRSFNTKYIEVYVYRDDVLIDIDEKYPVRIEGTTGEVS